MFGADAVERKFGAKPPAEWYAMLSRLKDFEIDRGLRRLAYSGKSYVPSLPEFTKLCRMVSDDSVDEGPQRFTALPSNEAKFDAADIIGNLRFLHYVTTRLSQESRAWGAAKTEEQAECTRIAVAYKNAWAQDMREDSTIDPNTGEMLLPAGEYQHKTFAQAMERAEEAIVNHRRELAA